MRRAVLILALLPLAACNPPARSASFFRAHSEETGKVLVDCDNAKMAEAQIESDKRLNLYRQAFEPHGEAGHGQ